MKKSVCPLSAGGRLRILGFLQEKGEILNGH